MVEEGQIEWEDENEETPKWLLYLGILLLTFVVSPELDLDGGLL